MTNSSKTVSVSESVMEGSGAQLPVRAPGVGPADLVIALVIVVLTAAAFWPGMSGEFLNWDDNKLLEENPHYRGFGAEQLRWMFTTSLLGHYQPLTWLSFALDWSIGGMEPRGYHLTNLAIFIASALVVYRLSVRLLARGARWASGGVSATCLRVGGAVAALLYAVHPLRVETVVWITNRAYVLSGLFVLLSVLFYLRYAERRAAREGGLGPWVLSLILYSMSLLCRANGVSLPLVLLLLDAYPLNRVGGSERGWFGRDARGVWMEKAPFFAAAALGSGLAHWAKSAVGTVASVESIPIVGRMGMAAYSTCFYLFKTVWPTNLLPLYEKPAQVDPFDPVFLMCGGGVVAITLVLFCVRRRWRAGWTCWMIYAVLLAPVSGLVQIGAQIAADRYTQLACVGWSVLVGAGVVWAWGRAQGRRSREGALAALVMLLMGVVAALVWLSREQSRMWRDSETLWARTLERDADCWVGLNNLGMVYGESGRHLEATELLGRALALRPEFPDAHMNLASLYLEQGRFPEAIREYEEAERRGLRDAQLYSNLAVAHFHQGDRERAMRLIDKALGLDPSNAEAHNNLGMIHFYMGRFEEAERAFEEALRLRPDYAKARENLEMVRAARGV